MKAPRAIGYLRVSTDRQAESGLGLEAQREAIERTAQRMGLELAHVCSDAGLSGALSLEDRPGLLEAISGLHRGDVLVIAKRDRLGRDVIAVAMIERLIEKKGARIVSAAGEGTESDEPTAILMRRLIDCFAEYERLLIGARTKAALRAKRSRGERAGNVPFGYRVGPDGKLVPEGVEQQTLTVIHECASAGYSLRSIAAELARLGHQTRTGAPWVHQYVANLLKPAKAA